MFRFGKKLMFARFRLQRSRERASHTQPQELCWSSELQGVHGAVMDSQEDTNSSPGVRGSDKGPHSMRMRSQAHDLCGDGVNRPRNRKLGSFAATLIRRIMSGSKVAPLTSHEQQGAPLPTVISDETPHDLARDTRETVPAKQEINRQAVDGKQSGRTSRKFSLSFTVRENLCMLINFVRNRLGMGLFRRGLGVVPSDQKSSLRRSVQTSLYARGPGEVMVDFETSHLFGECSRQNVKAGGNDGAGLLSALMHGRHTCGQSDEPRRSLEVKTADFKILTCDNHSMENDFTGNTNVTTFPDGEKELRKKNNRGLPNDANGTTSSPTVKITRENKQQKISSVVDKELKNQNDEHDRARVSCKLGNGIKRQQGHRQTYLAPSSLKSSKVDTIPTTEDQPNKNTLDIKPIDLANEIRELSPDARWLRIKTITSHLKRRIDLLTLRKFSSRVLPYTSDEGREIEENAGRAEELLEELHTLTKGAGKTREDETIQQKSIVGGKKQNQHRDASPKMCTTRQKTLLGNTIKVTAVGFVKEKLHAGRKRPAQKKRISKQRISSEPKAFIICPALNKRTYNKSSNQIQLGSPPRAIPADNKDLTALGLHILKENDVEHVMTKKGAPLKLGSGDYGDVFLMRATSDNSLMAVKRLTDVGSRNAPDKRTTDMMQEIKAMEAVRACKIFPTFLGILDNFSFAQEFVGNQQKHTSWSAYKLLYKSPRGPFLLPLDWTRISRDVTVGLKTLHQAGWTHNDLHIGNIMIWRDPKKLAAAWEAKIIDLGKASPISDPPPLKNLNRMEKIFAIENCPQMAPEIVEGRSHYNVKSDVYSLGVVLQDIAKQNRLLSCFNRIGKGCVVKDADKRPELKSVLKELNQLCCKSVIRKRTNRGAK